MSYKKSNWVPYDPTLSFEQNVTQGGTTTADKLNNMETGIGNAFDKTSDTIGGRNLLIGSTDNIVHYSSVTGYTVWESYVTQFNIGDTLNVSADITSNAGNTVLKVYLASSTGIQLGYLSHSVSEGQTAHAFVSKVIPTGTASILVQIDNSNSNGIGQADVCAINHQFANTGSVVANWVPAPEDKVTDNKDGSIIVNGKSILPFASNQNNNQPFGLDFNNYTQTGNYRFDNVVTINYPPMSSQPNYWQLIVFGNGTSVTQIACRIGSLVGMRQFYLGSGWSTWREIADDSKVVHTADMRKPASDVVGLEDVSTAVNKGLLSDGTDMHTLTNEGIYNLNGKTFVNFADTNNHWGTIQVINQNSVVVHIARATSSSGDHIWWESLSGQPSRWSTWHLLSDDSKVAHLSGANNFDTTPTVNNNPVATTNDVTTASNTVLTSANTSISKLLQSSSNNDEDSAVTNSTSDTSNFYYWTE